MAGYIFNLDNTTSLQLYAANGVYATKLSTPEGYWKLHHEGTFADYATMQPGDNIYFFIHRKIYGIGELVSVGGSDCKYFNFPAAAQPHAQDYETIRPALLWDESTFSIAQRCVCFFRPAPYFFRSGIDMDDVLSSRPQAFRMLRAFWKVSFLKFDEEENQAFKDAILKYNQPALANPDSAAFIFPTHFKKTHREAGTKIKTGHYDLDLSPVMETCTSAGSLNHEMALEMGMLQQLAQRQPHTTSIFGDWDYLSHQVVASPFKPVDYMDKMDIFGYAYIPGYKPTRSRYLVAELKKDTARLEHLDQLMKYVDWVNSEYAYGDYNMIHAFLVARSFDERVLEYRTITGSRKFTLGMRPARSLEWRNLKLVQYAFRKGKLVFSEINHGPQTLFSKINPKP